MIIKKVFFSIFPTTHLVSMSQGLEGFESEIESICWMWISADMNLSTVLDSSLKVVTG